MKPDVVAINCTVNADGTVIPDPGFGGDPTTDGPFRGDCQFRYFPAYGRTKAMIICDTEEDETAVESTPLIAVDYRDMVYFWLEEERINGVFNIQFFNKPTVGGAWPSVLNLSDYPIVPPASFDPSMVVTDGDYGWPVPDPALDPYYLTNGASIWVEGHDIFTTLPGPPGFEDMPPREVLAVGDMRTITLTIGPDDYEWDVYAITVRDFKYVTYTWAEWWGL